MQTWAYRGGGAYPPPRSARVQITPPSCGASERQAAKFGGRNPQQGLGSQPVVQHVANRVVSGSENLGIEVSNQTQHQCAVAGAQMTAGWKGKRFEGHPPGKKSTRIMRSDESHHRSHEGEEPQFCMLTSETRASGTAAPTLGSPRQRRWRRRKKWPRDERAAGIRRAKARATRIPAKGNECGGLPAAAPAARKDAALIGC